MRLLFFGALLALWWLGTAGGAASPAAVGERLRASVADGSLPAAIVISARRITLGYGFSLIAGILLGLLLARSRAADETVGSLVNGMQSLPSICWLPPALLWFGPGDAAVFFVIVMGAVWAIAQAVRSGIKSLPPQFARAGHMLGARGIRLWTHVLLPASLPTMLTGMRLGWAFAWRALMAGELIAPTLAPGIGRLLSAGRDAKDTAQMLAMLLVILAFGLLVDRLLFAPLERLVSRRWGVAGA